VVRKFERVNDRRRSMAAVPAAILIPHDSVQLHRNGPVRPTAALGHRLLHLQDLPCWSLLLSSLLRSAVSSPLGPTKR
jgi:hypothetical protein